MILGFPREWRRSGLPLVLGEIEGATVVTFRASSPRTRLELEVRYSHQSLGSLPTAVSTVCTSARVTNHLPPALLLWSFTRDPVSMLGVAVPLNV